MSMIFIGWSGTRSREVAEFLRGWLKAVFEAAAVCRKERELGGGLGDVSVWMSAKDIGAGKNWRDKLNEALRHADIGILCVTWENRESLYVTYEAGALANRGGQGGAGSTLVCPYLIDLSLSDEDLPPTLNQFKGVMAEEDATLTLVSDVCAFLAGKSGLSGSEAETCSVEAEEIAGRMWAGLGAKLAKVQLASHPRPGTLKDIINEDRKLTGDFKNVRGLIDAHESDIAGRLSAMARGIVSRYRKGEPFDLKAVTKRVYDEIKANLDEAMRANHLPANAESLIVGGIRKFFIDQFKIGTLRKMLKHEFKPLLDDTRQSNEAKILAMVDLLTVRKNQEFSRLHKALAAKFADYLERK
jgi:hypothetical protein